jgi:hypothetical protein
MPDEQIDFYFKKPKRLKEKYSNKIFLKRYGDLIIIRITKYAIQKFIIKIGETSTILSESVHYIYMDPVGVWSC